MEGDKQLKGFSCGHTFLRHKAVIRKRWPFPPKGRKASSKSSPREELPLIDPIRRLRHGGVALTYQMNSLSRGHPTQAPDRTHSDRCGLIKTYLMLTLLGRRSATVFHSPELGNIHTSYFGMLSHGYLVDFITCVPIIIHRQTPPAERVCGVLFVVNINRLRVIKRFDL